MNVLFAGNDEAITNTVTNSFTASLAPTTPAEATFEDANDAAATLVLAPTINIVTLAPVTPIEADFSSDDDTPNARVLAPVTPSVADFSDGN
jgi:hypothetical protein